MGGMSYGELAQWNKVGRKRTGTERLNELLGSILEGQQANKKQTMQDQLMQAKMMESGFTQQPQAQGMQGVLQGLMGGGQDYEFTGVPQSGLDQAKADWYNRRSAGGADKGMTSGAVKTRIAGAEATNPPSWWQSIIGAESKEAKAKKASIYEEYENQFLGDGSEQSPEERALIDDINRMMKEGGLERNEEDIVQYLVQQGVDANAAQEWVSKNV